MKKLKIVHIQFRGKRMKYEGLWCWCILVGCGEAARHAGMRRVKRLERLKRPAAAAGRDHDQTRRPEH